MAAFGTILAVESRASQISGTVLINGQPASSQLVKLRGLGENDLAEDAFTTKTGEYRFNHVPSGSYIVMVDKLDPNRFAVERGGVVSKLVDVTRGHKRGQDIEIVSASTISGFVQDDLGQRLPNIHLEPLSTFGIVARTDSAGQFRVTGLNALVDPKVTLELGMLNNEEARVSDIVILPGQETPGVVVVLHRTNENVISMKGRITFNGQAPPGFANVILSSDTRGYVSEIDKDGNYRILDVPAGEYTVTAIVNPTEGLTIAPALYLRQNAGEVIIVPGTTFVFDVDMTEADRK